MDSRPGAHWSLVGIIFIALAVHEATPVNGSGFGRCPNYPSMPKFNMSRLMGKWFEVERSFYLPEIASGCTTLTFQPDAAANVEAVNDNENRILSTNRIEVAVKTINQWTGSPSVNLGFAKPENSRSSIMQFQLSSRFPLQIARLLPGSGKYQFLYTDYDNFAILWSCSNFGFAFTDQIWILGRDTDFPVDIRKNIYDVLERLGMDSNRLNISKHTNCPNLL